MKFTHVVIVIANLLVLGCSSVTTDIVMGTAGKAGSQSPVLRNTQGNIYGYYEYLPEVFDETKSQKSPLIFYWNGANAISGNGTSQLKRLLSQGLPENINNGEHYSAIVISAMLENWRDEDPHDFVEYILLRYQGYYDPQRIYMTGFSAGGGVTVRYASAHPDKIAAIIPIAPAVKLPQSNEPSKEMAAIPSWFFHNSGDKVVEVWRSTEWIKALKSMGGDHRITIYDNQSHYAWQEAYQSKSTWDWLFSQKKI